MRNTFALLTIMLLTIIGLPVFAQSDARISGRIDDAKGQPIEAVTIILLKAKDSSRVKAVATDKTGHYRFDHVPAGKYLVTASSVGYQSSWSAPFDLAVTGTRSLSPLVLAPSSTNLQAFAVVGKKPF